MIGWIKSAFNWKYLLLIIFVIILGIIFYQYSECKKMGKKMGVAYKCPLFSTKPISIVAVDEYYDMRLGECFHYIDYGNTMSIRKVDIENCK